MHDNIVRFPERGFILRCQNCKVNAFYIILNSDNPYDIKHYECAECGDIFNLKTNEVKNMTDEQINKMVDRFLGWELPEDFCPDGGISFSSVGNHKPIGTNLLTATQAKEMIEYLIKSDST